MMAGGRDDPVILDISMSESVLIFAGEINSLIEGKMRTLAAGHSSEMGL